MDDIKTAKIDMRFPSTNQARACYTRCRVFLNEDAHGFATNPRRICTRLLPGYCELCTAGSVPDGLLSARVTCCDAAAHIGGGQVATAIHILLVLRRSHMHGRYNMDVTHCILDQA